MKKNWIYVTLITLIAVFFATAQVMASPANDARQFGKPMVTPGTQATAMASGHTQGNNASTLHGKRANYFGTILTVDLTSLVITLKDSTTQTFVLDSSTIIRIPTLGRGATVANLLVGMRVGVHAVNDAGTLTAKIVLAIPGKPALVHRVGVVTDYQAGVSITIQTKDGSTFTFLVNDKTKILPAERVDQLVVGATVTIIMPRDVTGGVATAKGIVVHPAAQP